MVWGCTVGEPGGEGIGIVAYAIQRRPTPARMAREPSSSEAFLKTLQLSRCLHRRRDALNSFIYTRSYAVELYFK